MSRISSWVLIALLVAAPVLEALADEQADLVALVNAPDESALVERLRSSEPRPRLIAAAALAARAARAKQATPGLVAVWRHDDPWVRRLAAATLRELGGAACPLLEEALGSSDLVRRREAAEVAGALGEEAAPLAKALAKAFVRDPRSREAFDAVRSAIERIGVERCAPALLEHGDRSELWVFLFATSIARTDERARAWIADALASSDSTFRSNAIVAACDARLSSVRPGLVARLDDPEPGVRSAAVRALALDSFLAKDSLALAEKALADPEAIVRVDAALALASRGRWDGLATLVSSITTSPWAWANPRDLDEATLARVARALGEAFDRATEEEHALRLARSLSQLGARGALVLGDVLDSDRPLPKRRIAARFLGGWGLEHALASGLRALRDPDALVRSPIARGLVRVGPAAASATPALAACARDALVEDRRAALAAIAGIGSGARAALPVVCEALGDAEPLVREAACAACSGLGAEATLARAELERAAKDESPAVRAAAAAALRAIGGADASFEPLLGDPSALVRREAAQAIADRATPATLPRLVRLLDDKDLPTRAAALEALRRVLASQSPQPVR